MSVNTVYPNDLIDQVAENLKDVEAVSAPAWAAFVKTGMHKERIPADKDWWYKRAAAILRTVYKLGPIGTQKLRTKYGGRKNRGHKPPEYSFEQFYNWLINQQKFEKLYNDWIASGCENNLKPSVDRPNDYKGYSLNNIQLMTWRENKEKYYSNND